MRLDKLITAMIGLALIAAACTGDGDGLDSDLADVTTSSTDDTVTTTDTTGTTTTSTTEAPPETRPTQTVEGAWAETWRVLLGLGPAGVANAGLATEEAADALGRLPIDNASTAEHYPRLETISGSVTTTGDIALTDCVVFNNTQPVWLTGNLTRTNETDDWVVTTINVIDPYGGCVPQEIADAAIQGAQAFWDAQTPIWNPADPDHPLVAQTTTQAYREFIEDLLGTHQAEGFTFEPDGSTPNFGVFVVDHSSTVVVRNCFTPGLDYGWFDGDGNRIEGSSPVVEGQTNYVEYTMNKESAEDGNEWRVSNVISSVNDSCDPDSTVDLPPVH